MQQSSGKWTAFQLVNRRARQAKRLALVRLCPRKHVNVFPLVNWQGPLFVLISGTELWVEKVRLDRRAVTEQRRALACKGTCQFKDLGYLQILILMRPQVHSDLILNVQFALTSCWIAKTHTHTHTGSGQGQVYCWDLPTNPLVATRQGTGPRWWCKACKGNKDCFVPLCYAEAKIATPVSDYVTRKILRITKTLSICMVKGLHFFFFLSLKQKWLPVSWGFSISGQCHQKRTWGSGTAEYK